MDQSQLSFSTRLSAVTAISTALKNAQPEANPQEIKEKARVIEEDACSRSSSLEEYYATWQESVSRLQPSPNAEPSAFHDPKIDDAHTLSPYQQIGLYSAQIHRRGLFSTVFRTHPAEGQRPFALKLTRPSQMSPPHDSRREARLLRKASHSSVVPFLEMFQQSGGGLVLVFPLLSMTLEDALSQTNPLPTSSILSHLRHLFSALAHVHSLGIVHRDIKPSNILLESPSGPAYLADFGIAWMGGDEASEPTHEKITDVGTTAYRPPELLFGYREYGCELDMWAAGCVVAECFSKKKTTLFNPGPLGSELGLIQSIFKTLGTPTEEIWPGVDKLPDWGKMTFYEYAPKSWEEILPNAPQNVRRLVSSLVRFEGSNRFTAQEVHSFTLFRARMKAKK